MAKFAAATARDEVDMERLTGALLGVVEETMQPERVSLWLTSPPGLFSRKRERGKRAVGGGPAGSFFACFLLDMAARAGLRVQVEIYEPRNYLQPGPAGCNMCAGIVSETLVQMLAAEGINLPSSVVQRGIDSYLTIAGMGALGNRAPGARRRPVVGTLATNPL